MALFFQPIPARRETPKRGEIVKLSPYQTPSVSSYLEPRCLLKEECWHYKRVSKGNRSKARSQIIVSHSRIVLSELEYWEWLWGNSSYWQQPRDIEIPRGCFTDHIPEVTEVTILYLFAQPLVRRGCVRCGAWISVQYENWSICPIRWKSLCDLRFFKFFMTMLYYCSKIKRVEGTQFINS